MDFRQIGLRVKHCRQKKHLTQEEFAEIVDVSPHYIYEIERGSKSMSIYTLDSVAAGLEVSTDYLLYGTIPGNEYKRHEADRLSLLVESVPVRKREAIANIIELILPYIK